jgi:hypothetical protein
MGRGGKESGGRDESFFRIASHVISRVKIKTLYFAHTVFFFFCVLSSFFVSLLFFLLSALFPRSV